MDFGRPYRGKDCVRWLLCLVIPAESSPDLSVRKLLLDIFEVQCTKYKVLGAPQVKPKPAAPQLPFQEAQVSIQQMPQSLNTGPLRGKHIKAGQDHRFSSEIHCGLQSAAPSNNRLKCHRYRQIRAIIRRIRLHRGTLEGVGILSFWTLFHPKVNDCVSSVSEGN